MNRRSGKLRYHDRGMTHVIHFPLALSTLLNHHRVPVDHSESVLPLRFSKSLRDSPKTIYAKTAA
jgi:hypothetical protein